jgi:5'-phosphate synthase pdxT subunit
MSAVGVLSLQGASEPHAACLRALGCEPREVRSPADLEGLTHLVLPGGESTTLARLLALFGLDRELVRRSRAGTLALFGTCAGAILAGRDEGQAPARLGLLDVAVQRNAYGPQRESRVEPLVLDAFARRFPCVFIRAPRFERPGASVRVLARRAGEPILVEGPGVLAASFHPELVGDPFLHRYFLDAHAPGRAAASAAGASRA